MIWRYKSIKINTETTLKLSSSCQDRFETEKTHKMTEVENKIREYGQKADRDGLKQYIESLDTDEVCC